MDPFKLFSVISGGVRYVGTAVTTPGATRDPGLEAWADEYPPPPVDWRQMAEQGLLPAKLVEYYEALEASGYRARLVYTQAQKQKLLERFGAGPAPDSDMTLPILAAAGAVGALALLGLGVVIVVKKKG